MKLTLCLNAVVQSKNFSFLKIGIISLTIKKLKRFKQCQLKPIELDLSFECTDV